jgi:hypothetical protein
LEWTHASFEQSLAEFHIIFLEEHLQDALEMLEVGICSSLYSPKLTGVIHSCSYVVTVLVRYDVEVRLHTLQAMTSCVNGGILGKLHRCSEITS